MASTAADIIASAKAEAEAARQSALSSLSGLGTELTNAYNKQTEAANSFYANELNNLQNTYTQDAKSAYANLMGNRQQLTNDLTRLGLTNSGYGVSQGLGLNTAYGKNLASLQNTLATNTANLGVKQGQELADLYSNYAKNKMDVDKYLYEAGQNAYNTMYGNAYQAKQDEISNALQQQYYNYLMSSGGGRGSSGGYSSYGGGSYEPDLTGETQKQETQKQTGTYLTPNVKHDPTLSTRAASDWYSANIGYKAAKGTLTLDEYDKLISSAVKNNKISSKDKKTIDKLFGL